MKMYQQSIVTKPENLFLLLCSFSSRFSSVAQKFSFTSRSNSLSKNYIRSLVSLSTASLTLKLKKNPWKPAMKTSLSKILHSRQRRSLLSLTSLLPKLKTPPQVQATSKKLSKISHSRQSRPLLLNSSLSGFLPLSRFLTAIEISSLKTWAPLACCPSHPSTKYLSRRKNQKTPLLATARISHTTCQPPIASTNSNYNF